MDTVVVVDNPTLDSFLSTFTPSSASKADDISVDFTSCKSIAVDGDAIDSSSRSTRKVSTSKKTIIASSNEP